MIMVWRYLRILIQVLGFVGLFATISHFIQPHVPELQNKAPRAIQNFGNYELIKDDPLAQPAFYSTGPRHDPHQVVVQLPPPGNHTERVKAGFIVLVRNSELSGILESMYDIEEHFNSKFGYPWVFLNDEPFTKEFTELTTAATVGKTYYGLVPHSMWSYPPWINQTFAAESRKKMEGLPYGSSESYRHMCRFQSGFFWRHPLVLSMGWEYYWRVEPSVRYYCLLDYDPFLFMKQNNKKYGFTISFKEHSGTIPTLWSTVKKFAKLTSAAGKPAFPLKTDESLYRFITENSDSYNLCHFWTNFEIARLDLWQSENYNQFFDFLDAQGGFFYERWGDAPVHSIYAAMVLRKEEFHYFADIGYKHSIYTHCPEPENLARRCYCDPATTLDYTDIMSCLNEYMDALKYVSDNPGQTVNDALVSKA